ncbi:MAG: gliding motility-associated ABC transporter ATP-binding subunit GldA [Bacteroidetes bacterium]|nr:gliding motility-associated ABC transporter ATP-binding subunit GldA [Bacteroidota bacterium]
MSVEVKKLTKVFDGQAAVDDVSFVARENEILGFLGPNGAGKSTTMKIITCFLPPDEGSILVNGLDVMDDSKKVKKLIGYLPENNPLYLDMFVHEYLRFVGKLNELRGGELKLRVNEIIMLCGLERQQNKLIGSLSKGYRQRVGLAQALIHDPDVLILDEPTTGLDPNQILDVRKLIKDISTNKTVILSTHIMQEVEAICDKVVIINEGKIVADGTLQELQNMKKAEQKIKIKLAEAVPTTEIENLQEVKNVEILKDENSALVLAIEGMDARGPLNKLLIELNLNLLEMTLQEDSLEDVFRQITNPRS